jgi:hypothetical protein
VRERGGLLSFVGVPVAALARFATVLRRTEVGGRAAPWERSCRGPSGPLSACYSSTMASFEERARARALWPIRTVALGDESLTDDRDTSSVDERIALVATLTLEQWRFSGRELPTYSRAEMPGRVVRASE